MGYTPTIVRPIASSCHSANFLPRQVPLKVLSLTLETTFQCPSLHVVRIRNLTTAAEISSPGENEAYDSYIPYRRNATHHYLTPRRLLSMRNAKSAAAARMTLMSDSNGKLLKWSPPSFYGYLAMRPPNIKQRRE